MAREFTVGGGGLTLANQPVTLVFLNQSATAPTPNAQIMRMWASQQGSTSSAQQRIQAETQVSVFPTLVSATPRHLKLADSTASVFSGGTAGAAGTCGINASAEGAGTKTAMFDDNFNVLNGWIWNATLPELIDLGGVSASTIGGFGLFLPAAAGSLTNWAAGINFREGS